MKYVVYDNFDDFYVSILGICDTGADAQELILAAAEEEAYNDFLDNYYYDETGITVEPGENPIDAYLRDMTLEWENYNKRKLRNHPGTSFYGWLLITHAEYYHYSSGEEY